MLGPTRTLISRIEVEVIHEMVRKPIEGKLLYPLRFVIDMAWYPCHPFQHNQQFRCRLAKIKLIKNIVD